MTQDQIEHLNELKQIHQKRLQVLEKQAAKFGSFTPPYVLLEIEELKVEIKKIETQLSKNEPVETSIATEFKEQTIKILFLAANPTNSSRLRVGSEARDIREKLQLGRLRERFVLSERWSVRPQDITAAIFNVEPDIVHFSGHGSKRGELCFENISGFLYPVSPQALSSLFELVSDKVRCVILNACYAEIQAKAIAKHIDFVIGMNNAISDRAAITFSVGFYKALAAGRGIKDAYKFGIVELQLMGITEHNTPVLVSRYSR